MKIVLSPNKVLTGQAKPVGKIDNKIRQIIKEMKKGLFESEIGVGLAAPQVGLPSAGQLLKAVFPFPISGEKLPEKKKQLLLILTNSAKNGRKLLPDFWQLLSSMKWTI